MNFNNKRFLELMKESIVLHQEGKSLRNHDTIKYEELNAYLILLEDDIIWKSRTRYLQIILRFVTKIITIEDFIIQYNQLLKSNREAFEKLKKYLEEKLSQSSVIELDINPQSSEFAKIIFSLQDEIEFFDPYITLEMNLKDPEFLKYGISEQLFRFHLVETVIPKQNYFIFLFNQNL